MNRKFATVKVQACGESSAYICCDEECDPFGDAELACEIHEQRQEKVVVIAYLAQRTLQSGACEKQSAYIVFHIEAKHMAGGLGVLLSR